MDQRAWDGSTAVIAASMGGHVDCVKALYNANADLRAKSYDGTCALIAATCYGHVDTCEFLLTHASDLVHVSKNDQYTALHYASQLASADVM